LGVGATELGARLALPPRRGGLSGHPGGSLALGRQWRDAGHGHIEQLFFQVGTPDLVPGFLGGRGLWGASWLDLLAALDRSPARPGFSRGAWGSLTFLLTSPPVGSVARRAWRGWRRARRASPRASRLRSENPGRPAPGGRGGCVRPRRSDPASTSGRGPAPC